MKAFSARAIPLFGPLALALLGMSAVDCGDDNNDASTADASTTSDAAATGTADGGTEGDAAASADGGDASTIVAACDPTYVDSVLAAIATFESAIGTTLTAATEFDDSANSTTQLDVYKTNWSNLPPGAISFSRPGITLSELSGATQINAFNALVQAALSSAGYTDYTGVLAADDYLGYTQNANGYGANLYHVAVVGTPSETGLWTLMFGGHHMAFNITFNAACSYPTPHHIGVEPRTQFTSNDHYTATNGTAVYPSTSYQVLATKASAMSAIFSGLSGTELASAFLTGQIFNDILIGPVEANTGLYSAVTAKFDAIASSSDRGLLVSSLPADEQALVTATIQAYVGDYDTATATRLLADYESGYASTYVAWANASGTATTTPPDVTESGTYMRIDGPRAWIEIACQAGIVIQGQSHYHMMFRDKTYDYYNELVGSAGNDAGTSTIGGGMGDGGGGMMGGPQGDGGMMGGPPGDGGIGGP